MERTCQGPDCLLQRWGRLLAGSNSEPTADEQGAARRHRQWRRRDGDEQGLEHSVSFVLRFLNVSRVEYMGQGKSGFCAYFAAPLVTNERDQTYTSLLHILC